MNLQETHHKPLMAFMRMVTFVALILRFLIPQGFMIDDQSAKMGRLQIVICHAQGSETSFIDLKNINKASEKSNKDTKKLNSEHCNFSSISNSIDLSQDQQIYLASIFEHVAQNFDQKNIEIGHGLAAPPPPATGPPTLA